jgi:hypothetical protein
MLFSHSCASSLSRGRYDNTARARSKVAESVDTFGFVLLTLIDGTNRVVGGCRWYLRPRGSA